MNSSPTISNCIISHNQASEGGGIYCEDSQSEIRNCLIINNNATNSGGGIYCRDSEAYITNCTITGNSDATGVHCAGGTLDVTLNTGDTIAIAAFGPAISASG